MPRLFQPGASHGAGGSLLADNRRPAVWLTAAAVAGMSAVLGLSANFTNSRAALNQHEVAGNSTSQADRDRIRSHLTLPRPEQNASRVIGVAHQSADAPSRQGRGSATVQRAGVPGSAIPSLHPEVVGALQTAAGGQEGDRTLLFALAWRESRFDPRADNPASSARGLMQFTRETWLEAIRDHGATHGLARYASAVVTDRSTGRLSVRHSRTLAELLALRDDPRLSATMAMARLGRERDRLSHALQRPVTDADLYLVHFLGPVGARHFLRHLARAPSHRASDYVGSEAVAANRSAFVSSKGRHLSLREVYTDVQRTLDSQRVVYAVLAERMQSPEGRVQVASAQ
jgi:hypothetical protein